MRLVISKMSTTLGFLFLSILILSVKSSNVNSDCSESRIIFEGHKDGLHCFKACATLKCTCSKGVNLVPGGSKPTQAFQHLNETIHQANPQKLFFENCFFNTIGRRVFLEMMQIKIHSCFSPAQV